MDTPVYPMEPTPVFPERSIVTDADREECRQALVPVSEVLAQIGGKWTIHIIMALGAGPLRFSELLRGIDGISQKMLTATLRDLERTGSSAARSRPAFRPVSTMS
jgi:DNA-binding HxlR family transcriptional regulator